MAVGTWVDPDFQTQTGTTLKTNYDNAHAVAKRFANAYAPHEDATPDMTVRLEAGYVFDPVTRTLTEKAAQSTTTITAPTTNPRIDRVVVDQLTGTVSVITGTEAASPSAPAITQGKIPIAQVLLNDDPATTAIDNSLITDERVLNTLGQPLGTSAVLAYNSVSDTSVTGNGTVIDPVDFDTEVYDVGDDFASDVFTAPVDGYYLLCMRVAFASLTAGSRDGIADIFTSNRIYGNSTSHQIGVNAGNWFVNLSCVADMDASDTAKVRARITGEGTDTVDIVGGSPLHTFFSAFLLSAK